MLEAREPKDDSHLLAVVSLAGRETHDPCLLPVTEKNKRVSRAFCVALA